jgi:hypothetical protein
MIATGSPPLRLHPLFMESGFTALKKGAWSFLSRLIFFRSEEDVHYLLFKKDGLMIRRDVQAKGT